MRLGGSCGYPNDASSDSYELLDGTPFESALSRQTSLSMSPLTSPITSPVSLLGAASYDPFESLPAKIAHQSTRFVDYCAYAVSALLELKFECRHKVKHYQTKNYRILVRGAAIGVKIFAFAMSDPIVFHGALLLTAEHMKVVGDESPDLDSALLHHKVEVIRLVNERLGNPQMAASDGTVGGIACLAILESLHGAYQVADMHLNGLEQLMKIRGGWKNSDNEQVLQALIMLSDVLSASALQSTSRFSVDNEDLSQVDVPDSPSLGHHDVADVTYYEMTNGLDAETSKMFLELRTLSYHIGAQDRYTTPVNVGDRFGDVRRYINDRLTAAQQNAMGWGFSLSKITTCYITGSIYLHYLLMKAPRDSALVSQALSHLRQELETTKSNPPHSSMPSQLLFWVLFVACAAAKGGPESWWFFKELADCNSELEIESWEEAKEMLWRFAWVPYIGDEIGEEVWTEINRHGTFMIET